MPNRRQACEGVRASQSNGGPVVSELPDGGGEPLIEDPGQILASTPLVPFVGDLGQTLPPVGHHQGE